jgi:hypothetical protein
MPDILYEPYRLLVRMRSEKQGGFFREGKRYAMRVRFGIVVAFILAIILFPVGALLANTIYVPVVRNGPTPSSKVATSTPTMSTATLTPTPTVTLTPIHSPTPTPTPTATLTPIHSPTPTPTPTAPSAQTCDSAYPDVCIPPPPPDLDCGEILYRDFRVLPPDPHGFDGNNDGIGCES